MSTRTRFEKEATGNSEMAYSRRYREKRTTQGNSLWLERGGLLIIVAARMKVTTRTRYARTHSDNIEQGRTVGQH